MVINIFQKIQQLLDLKNALITKTVEDPQGGGWRRAREGMGDDRLTSCKWIAWLSPPGVS